MDKKERLILKHYKKVIENRIFDEYDILGFLIFIRRHLGNKYNAILEFSDLIAHRNRKKGMVMTAISKAIDNNYKTFNHTKKVMGYHGIETRKLIEQFKKWGVKYGINFTDECLQEIIMCIFSLAQFTCYSDGKHRGKLMLVQGKNKLALVTTEGKGDSPYVSFSVLEGCKFVRMVNVGILDNPVEAVRESGILRLKDSDGYII
jgi:hypothetical protein